eukprot:GHVT01018946.1.p1 GENE.GHVT01018946.1~~GHVT01018946.1.p1  ORF type:complete len:156 (+),score=25.98 GHVT01018946.1:503-970(+)
MKWKERKKKRKAYREEGKKKRKKVTEATNSSGPTYVHVHQLRGNFWFNQILYLLIYYFLPLPPSFLLSLPSSVARPLPYPPVGCPYSSSRRLLTSSVSSKLSSCCPSSSSTLAVRTAFASRKKSKGGPVFASLLAGCVPSGSLGLNTREAGATKN